MSYMDRTFCPPELADKPDCAECWRRFDEQKYRMHCANTGFDEDVSFSAVRLCELNTSQKPVATKPKYYSNTNFSKMVFRSDDANNDTTCGKIDRANTTKRDLKMNDAELETKINRAIDVLRTNEPTGGYGLAFSGGKDSCVIKQLAIESGVNFKSFYSVTTLDPPELVRFIQTHHKDVQWVRQKRAMLRQMSDYKLFPPNQFCRWCCQIYKEGSLKEFSAKIIGVRASESIRRARLWKEVVEDNTSKKRKIICPIVDWTDEDVWTFIRDRRIPYCSLYDEGFKRLGCIGCPLSGAKNIKREFERWRGFEHAWRMAFRRMWVNCQTRQTTPRSKKPYHGLRYKNGDEWFEDYIANAGRMTIRETCQMELMFVGGIEDEL